MRFNGWIAVSLLIHAAVVLPFMISAFSPPSPKAGVARLDLELFGMLSDREAEEEPADGLPELPPGPKPKPEPEPEPEEPPVQPPDELLPEPAAELPIETEEYLPDPDPIPAAESAVMIPAARPVFETAEEVTGNSAAVPFTEGIDIGGGGGSGGRDAAGAQGKTSGSAGAADALSLYTARVARRLQANLVYPEKMRRNGIEAVTTIIFTVNGSGQIIRDSLKVRKSSGYKEMDDNALKAARESAPFDKPPKEITLVIDVAFEVGRFRR